MFHAGCRYSFDGEQSGVARTAVTLLKKAGIDFGIMGAAESCCGGVLLHRCRRAIKDCAKANLAKWRKAGVDTVVTPCADCYYAFKRLYPEHAGSTIRVVHMVELLDKVMRGRQLKLTRP